MNAQIRIPLLVSTVVLIMSALVIYWLVNGSGNGGEYWGFDGHTSASQEAIERVGAGEFTFLEVAISDPFTEQRPYVPGVATCDSSEFQHSTPMRGTTIPKHGADSYRLADGFARTFNISMAEKLNETRGAKCVILYSK